VRNQAQLITYADRLGGTLPGLTELRNPPPRRARPHTSSIKA
jgi:hypothetical protein